METRNQEKSPGLIARLLDAAVQWTAAVIVAGLIFLAGKYYLFDRLDGEICNRCEIMLKERYAGLNISVSSARRIEGKGIEIRGIAIREGGDEHSPVIVNIEQLFAECATDLPEMLTRPPTFRRVTIRGVRMRAERKPSGTWNVAHLWPLPAGDGAGFPVELEDVVVEIVDPTRAAALTLRDIRLSLEPERTLPGQPVKYRVVGNGTGDHFDRATWEGKFSRGGADWSLTGGVEGLEFTPRLRAALPTDCDKWLEPLASVRGRTRFNFEVSHSGLKDAALQFNIAGNVSEGRIDDNRLPESLTDVVADVSADNRGLKITGVAAKCGPGELSGSLTTGGFTANSPIDVQLKLKGWPLDRCPRELPARLQDELKKLNLRGAADVSGRFTFDGKTWKRNAVATARQVSLQHTAFNYPLTDGEGRLQDDGNSVRAELRALAGSTPITIVAEFPTAQGPAGAGRVDIRSEKPVLIDERFLAALEPNAQKVVRSLSPQGTISVVGRIERTAPDRPPLKSWRIELHDLALRYDKFSYPFFNVRGTLESVDGQWTFKNLSGRNDCGHVTGEGFLKTSPDQPSRLELAFKAGDVPLGEDLRRALNPGAQRLWDSIQPRGTLDVLNVNIGYDVGRPESFALTIQGKKWGPQQNVAGRGITLTPAQFPLRLDQVTGEFLFDRGQISLSGFSARRGESTLSSGCVCRPRPNGGWSVVFDKIAIDRLQVDHELLQALPREVAAGVAKADVRGPVGISGKVELQLPDNDREAYAADWDLNVDLENGGLDVGVPLEHIFGGVRLVGRGGPQGFASRGELAVDSFIARGIQVSNVRGPLTIDRQRITLGEWSAPPVNGKAPPPVTGNVFGGRIVLDAGREFNEDGRFALQASLDEANLWNVMLEVMPKHLGITGRAYASLALQGSAKGMHTWKGNGAVRLRDADIFDVPLIFALFKQLSIRRQDSVPFSDANMDFRVEGEDLQFDRLDFHGEVVSLKGRGRMTMTEQRPVDLQFYTQVGRDEIQLPLLRPLLGEASRSFLLIEVSGNADNPQVTKKAFPAINDQLRQLFPELRSAEAASEARPGVIRRR